MTIESLGTLSILALIDSASFGTLLIPVWLLMTPGKLRMGRVFAYLATVTVAYFLIGITLVLGANSIYRTFSTWFDTNLFRYLQLTIGLILLAVSQLMDSKSARARAAARARAGNGRLFRWRAKAVGENTSSGTNGTLIVLALSAVAIEAASMLPFLAGIGIITASSSGWSVTLLLVLGYCMVMILPAIILTMGRMIAPSSLDAPLARLENWLSRNAQAMTAWVIGIVGFVLAAQAVNALWFGV